MITSDEINARVVQRPDVRGATITLFGGGYFDFANPECSPIRLVDIVRGLSTKTRFSGQCTRGDGFYSVAQHSILVAQLCPRKHAFAGLMHDAGEAYTGDMVSPLKQLCPDFKAIEDRVEQAVMARFELPWPMNHAVKKADLGALRTEQRDLTSGSADNWSGLDDYESHPDPIFPMSPAAAAAAFIGAFVELAPQHLIDRESNDDPSMWDAIFSREALSCMS